MPRVQLYGPYKCFLRFYSVFCNKMKFKNKMKN